jgi:K+-transporting ATPase c subunit
MAIFGFIRVYLCSSVANKGFFIMKQLIIALRVTLVFAILTGVAYPLLVTGLAKVIFPHQADRVQGDVKKFREANPGATGPLPADLLTASGSGLDPDISPASAEVQVPRVAAARGMSADALRELVASHTEGRQFGILGEPRVNVLKLNLALDQAAPVKK